MMRYGMLIAGLLFIANGAANAQTITNLTLNPTTITGGNTRLNAEA